jgi:hypothetical protein
MEPRRPAGVFGRLDQLTGFGNVPDAAGGRDGTKKTAGGLWPLGSADVIWKRSRCGRGAAMEPRRPAGVFGRLDQLTGFGNVPDAAGGRDGTKKTGGGFWALGSADGIWKRSRCGRRRRWNQRRAPAFLGAWMEHVLDAAVFSHPCS